MNILNYEPKQHKFDAKRIINIQCAKNKLKIICVILRRGRSHCSPLLKP